MIQLGTSIESSVLLTHGVVPRSPTLCLQWQVFDKVRDSIFIKISPSRHTIKKRHRLYAVLCSCYRAA